MRQLPAVTIRHEITQRILQVGAHVAAQASIPQQDGFVRARTQQCVVDTGFAEFVDDHCGVAAFRSVEKMLHQRGLAGAQEPGHDRDRNARTAFMPQPPAETARLWR